jgi:hypothetical protein
MRCSLVYQRRRLRGFDWHAVCAGPELSRGRAVLVMDGDLQHPPSLIPQMLPCWRAGGTDIVEAVKREICGPCIDRLHDRDPLAPADR